MDNEDFWDLFKVKAEFDHMAELQTKNVGFKNRIKDIWDEFIDIGVL